MVTGGHAPGTAQLAATANRLGEEYLQNEERTQYADARSKFLQAKVAQDNAYDDDPDHGTWAARYQQQLGQAQQSIASGISSGRARAQFNDQASLDLAQGSARLANASRLRVKDEGRAAMWDAVDSNLDAAKNSSDPATREQLLNATHETITAARQSGFIDNVEEVHYRQTAVKNYLTDLTNQFGTNLETKLDRAGNALLADPSKFNAIKDEITGSIATSGIHERDRARFTDKALNQLSWNAVQGSVGPLSRQRQEAGRDASDRYGNQNWTERRYCRRASRHERSLGQCRGYGFGHSRIYGAGQSNPAARGFGGFSRS